MTPEEFRQVPEIQSGEYKQIYNWIDKNLHYISAGVTRAAYDLDIDDQQYVVKVLIVGEYSGRTSANRREVDNYECLGKEYAAEIIDYDKQHFYWMIMEKVEVLEPEYFTRAIQQTLFGDSSILAVPQEFDQFIMMNLLTNRPHTRYIHDNLYKVNDWYRGLYDRVKRCRIQASDLGSDNWGFRQSSDIPVLIDYSYNIKSEQQLVRFTSFCF